MTMLLFVRRYAITVSSMRSIAHIVKPVSADASVDLRKAQAITFESMRRARNMASTSINVQLLTTQYLEDSEYVPHDFTRLTNLERSILDVGSFRIPRKLPLLRDILDRLYSETDAEYLVYTNVDIALMPHFYILVDQYLAEGCDALVINRRTISDGYSGISDLPKMYAEYGRTHPGYDCFVIHRDLYPKLHIGDVCLGMLHLPIPLVCSMLAEAKKCLVRTHDHATFHLGDPRTWLSLKYSDYNLHNYRETRKVLKRLSREHKQKPGWLYHILLHLHILCGRYCVWAWERAKR